MSVESFKPLTIEQFGSLVTSVDPADVPPGLSPANQDVEYYTGGLRTRPGTTAAYDAIGVAATASIRGLKSYVTLALTQQILTLDSDGRFSVGEIGTPMALFRAGFRSGSRLKSITLFGSEFLGFSDGTVGIDRPMQYDSTRMDRVSMCGPGDAPTAIEPVGVAQAIETIANSGAMRTTNVATIKLVPMAITPAGAGAGAIRTANVATINVVAHGRAVGDQINVSGVSDATFNLNGLTVTAVPDANHLSYVSAGADVVAGAAGGGTIAQYVAVGASVLIAGVSDASFSGRHTVTTTPTYNTFTFASVGADVVAATAGGGIATFNAFGSIEVGTRKVVYWWITRTGYWTKFSPPVAYAASGGSKVQVTVPIGPTNVVARGVGITSSNGARYYHLADRMLIRDNATTTITIDFGDTTLTSGLSVDYLQDLEVLNYAAAPIEYANRMVWIGEENGMPGFLNLTFEGGTRATGRPMGWIEDLASAGGQVIDLEPGDFGCCYRITGDGVTAAVGGIKQSMVADIWTNTQLAKIQQSYTIRCRVRKSAGLVSGFFNIDAYGTAGVLVDSAGLKLGSADLTTQWQEFEAILMPAQAALPTDLVIRVFADGTPTNGQYFEVDELRILPTDELEIGSRARISMESDAESYRGTNGFIMVKENNGQSIRAGFVLRNFLYFVKERSLHVTQDDGVSEPANWSLEEVSPTIGTPSLHGVDVGDNWAIIANKNGAYFFNGSDQLISGELQNSDPTKGTWSRINWDKAGHKVWVRVDTKNRRVLFGVPLDGALECTHILYLDYSDAPGPQGALLIDPLQNEGRGRKWSIWNLAMGCSTVIETSGTSRVLLGNNAGTGKIYELNPAARGSDDGVATDGWYETAYLGGSGFGSRLFGYMVQAIEGSGTLIQRCWRPGKQTAELIPNRKLSTPCRRDLEIPLNVDDNRLSFRIRTNAVGSWFSIARWVLYWKQSPWSGK